MKKLFIALVATVTFSATAFAAPVTKISHVVNTSFKREFGDAKNVQWGSFSNYTYAAFQQNNENVRAYFSNNGDFVGTGKAIVISDLPTFAKRNIARRFTQYNLRDAIVFETPEETAYFITAENEKQSVIIRVTSFGAGIFKVLHKQ